MKRRNSFRIFGYRAGGARTDRDNPRTQAFDSTRGFLDLSPNDGGVSTLLLTADQQIWAGGVLRELDETIAAELPGNVGGHGTTAAPDGSVSVAQQSGIVQKFVLE